MKNEKPRKMYANCEMVENARRMANAVEIPLVSDADQGFGNAINTRRTVQEFIKAGVAGIHIEDQTAPTRCGFVKEGTIREGFYWPDKGIVDLTVYSLLPTDKKPKSTGPAYYL